jgi:hypothetical protein
MTSRSTRLEMFTALTGSCRNCRIGSLHLVLFCICACCTFSLYVYHPFRRKMSRVRIFIFCYHALPRLSSSQTYDSAYESDTEGDFEDLEAQNLETSKTTDAMEVDHDTNAEDEDDWGGVSDSKFQPVVAKATRRSHLPPSREELRTILDASTLFRDSAFKLKVVFSI